MKPLHAVLLIGAGWTGRLASAQCQAQKLVATDAGGGDQFGRVISASGDWLIVGAPFDDDLGAQLTGKVVRRMTVATT